MNRSIFLCAVALVFLAGTARAAIAIAGVADKTKYPTSVAFTVTADPGAASTTATLDGVATVVGSQVTVTAVSYHELKAESRTAGGALVDSKTVRFIVTDDSRKGSEDGIPPHTPLRTVNDAPSAFAGQTLKVIAPAAWPAGLPIPMAVKLVNGADETVRLGGTVSFAGFPQTTLQLRRGWGSVVAPAATAAGTLNVGARVNGVTRDLPIAIEAAPTFSEVTGTISTPTVYPANARIHISGTLTIAAGASLTVNAGTILALAPSVEIIVNGTLQIDGNELNPIVFTPDASGASWGGIELPVATSNVVATHTIFTGSGEDQTWFSTHGGYSSHKDQQALFLISGSGSGTNVGAQLHLANCYAFSLRGQEMNSKTNTWIDLSRTLMQRAITCGELNGSKVTIDRCALIEFPSEDATFVDGDNDAIYLTNGDLSITNSVIGFTKDDGVDSGANGGDNPYTAAVDVTPYACTNNWFEGTYHEGNSLSGTRNVAFTGCVFYHCGQGVEDGYSTNATADGPNALVDGCLFASNMVGVRWGDNYGSGYSYNGSMEVKNSLLLYSLYRDAFSGQWNPTAANAWIYEDAAANNTFGHPYFNLHDNYISQPDPVHHPANTTWNPAVHGSLIAPFMPVPGSNVGVAISNYAPAQSDTAAYPGVFTVRLSSFSSQQVKVDWSVIAKIDAFSDTENILASGTLTFPPGETIRTIAAPVANPVNYGLIHVALTNATNAEVTGEAWYFRPPPASNAALIAKASSGWRYRETRSDPPSTWKKLAFDDTGAEWAAATLPAGFALTTAFNPPVTFGTTPGYGGDININNKTKAYYFRKTFTVADPGLVSSLTFNVRRDDGVVAWLNDDLAPTVISADSTWSAPYNYDNLAPNATTTDAYVTYSIPASKLVPGPNILAIELHQSSITSSDLLLDCELLASYAPFDLRITRVGARPVLYWFDSSARLEESLDLHTWMTAPGASSPQTFTPTVPQAFFRLRR
jgi:hypothetical protein